MKMPVLYKELRKGLKGFIIWTAIITFMILVCVFMYPEMKTQMDGMNDLFANMGMFTSAFGMDKLNFGTLIGFYGVECGNMLGLGGGFFAAFLGISMLAKEEKEHTAEFLLTHPIKKSSVVLQKLCAVVIQIVALNVIVVLASAASIAMIGEDIPMKEFLLIHVGYFLLQLEIAVICFGISAFMSNSGIAMGLGVAVIFYFMNIICNLSEKAEFLKYITPYAYAEPADIVANKCLGGLSIALGMLYMIVVLLIGFTKYTKKDIAA